MDSIEDQLTEKVSEIMTIIKARDTYFQEAAALYVVRELCWALVDEDESMAPIGGAELSDHLKVMADNVRIAEKARYEAK